VTLTTTPGGLPPDGRRFVTVPAAGVLYTGFDQVSRRVSRWTGQVTSEQPTDTYLALPAGNRYLVARVPVSLLPNGQLTVTEFTGRLVPVPADVGAALGTGRLLPVLLEVDPSYRDWTLTTMALGLAASVFGAWNLARVRQRRRDSLRHPIATILGRHGDPVEVAQEIDAEARAAKVELTSKVTLTAHWLIVSKDFNDELLPLHDLAWVYKKLTKKKLYGVVTVNTTAAIVLVDRARRKIEFECDNEEDADPILQKIVVAQPFVYAGYDKQLEVATHDAWTAAIARLDAFRGT
jgi:hypothetical protein